MYKNRYQFWQDVRSQDNEFNRFYPTYEKFEKHFFSDENSFLKFFNLLRDNYDFSEDIDECYKKFTCDIEWAKTKEFCKKSEIDIKKNVWVKMSDEEKNKWFGSQFFQAYPCLSLIDGYKYIYDDGSTQYALVERFEDEKVFYYKNGIYTKYKGTNKIDSGNFKCNEKQ